MLEELWRRLLERLPRLDEAEGQPLAVALIESRDYAARCGPAWLWWPGRRAVDAQAVVFDGRYPPQWGLLLVMEAQAIEKLGAGEAAPIGTAMASLVRQLSIKPFVLKQREELEAGGVLEFIETLELATPKH